MIDTHSLRNSSSNHLGAYTMTFLFAQRLNSRRPHPQSRRLAYFAKCKS